MARVVEILWYYVFRAISYRYRFPYLGTSMATGCVAFYTDTAYSATAIKNQFSFFFVFQNYVTEPLSDRSFKPSFQKEICLF